MVGRPGVAVCRGGGFIRGGGAGQELFIIKLVCPRPLALLRTLELAAVGVNYRKFLLPYGCYGPNGRNGSS
jgi:hypothetical protein